MGVLAGGAAAAFLGPLGATLQSIREQRKARKQQKRAARIAQRRADIERRRAAIASIEDARQLVGQIQNVAAQTGAQGGSGAQGAIGSITSQLGANLTFNEQLDTFARRQAKYLEQAQDSMARAQTFQQIAQIGMSVAKAGMG